MAYNNNKEKFPERGFEPLLALAEAGELLEAMTSPPRRTGAVCIREPFCAHHDQQQTAATRSCSPPKNHKLLPPVLGDALFEQSAEEGRARRSPRSTEESRALADKFAKFRGRQKQKEVVQNKRSPPRLGDGQTSPTRGSASHQPTDLGCSEGKDLVLYVPASLGQHGGSSSRSSPRRCLKRGRDTVGEHEEAADEDPWSQEELDSLWVGVRRHGEGNWEALLEDPSLKFSKRNTSDRLSRRWKGERGTILHPEMSNPHYPSPSDGSKVPRPPQTPLLLLGGRFKLPVIGKEGWDHGQSSTVPLINNHQNLGFSLEGTQSG